ncbi:MAG: radical SAM protein [Verrucomicrobiae bacterium]|nr:radical SAM protein [Verrucomicrobiae bacterium]
MPLKVAIAYPPLPDERGVPLLSQNRQFQWFNKPTFIYPCVPAYAATLLKQAGHEVFWEDGIAQQDAEDAFEKRFVEICPDVAAIEVKTPIVKRYWKWVDRLKEQCPGAKIVLMGDHVTALPEESLRQCRADYVLTGGDYDFALVNLCAHLENRTPLEPGVYRWRDGRRDDSDRIVNTGRAELKRPLDSLPLIDRELTKWKLYARENGNFKRLPGAYTMAGRDCWWGRCRFCSWTTLFANFRCQPPGRLLDEVGHLIDLGVREIFDDTGTFPTGGWLSEFCAGMVQRGYHRKVMIGCNMIPGVLKEADYERMAKAGFRFLLFGLESAIQTTLDRVHKLGQADEIGESMRMAKNAGLMPHVTCMVGYPWETREDARRTIEFTRRLFDQGYIDTLQATIVIPYPGTPLFKECKENGWLRSENWDDFDMRSPIMKCPIPDEELLAMTRGIYTSFLTPRFIWRQIAAVRNLEDAAYLARGGMRLVGHLLDFNFFGLGQRQTRKVRQASKGTQTLDEPVSPTPAPEPHGRVARPMPAARQRKAADGD